MIIKEYYSVCLDAYEIAYSLLADTESDDDSIGTPAFCSVTCRDLIASKIIYRQLGYPSPNDYYVRCSHPIKPINKTLDLIISYRDEYDFSLLNKFQEDLQILPFEIIEVETHRGVLILKVDSYWAEHPLRISALTLIIRCCFNHDTPEDNFLKIWDEEDMDYESYDARLSYNWDFNEFLLDVIKDPVKYEVLEYPGEYYPDSYKSKPSDYIDNRTEGRKCYQKVKDSGLVMVFNKTF